ncbi:hypothetical protein ACQEVG_10625 [Streptomyces sp. CA-135486]|uniref:hypothetical protein n=1 Tax=Streptomyces sp. CA-135486 TaxID=3240049 RepID=UPI003D9374D9
MRPTWRYASVLAAVTVTLWTAPLAASQQHRDKPKPEPKAQAFEADCRTVIDGSRATAYCHNPYPATDRVQLHIECGRWWDIDVDSAPVDIAPAGYAELTDRCWKEISSVWISHQPQRDAAGT